MEYSSAVLQVQGGIEVKVPVKLSYKRIDPNEQLPPQLVSAPRVVVPPPATSRPAPRVPGAPPPTNNVPTNTAPTALAPAAAPRPGGAGKKAKLSDEDFAATLADVQLGGADFRAVTWRSASSTRPRSTMNAGPRCAPPSSR